MINLLRKWRKPFAQDQIWKSKKGCTTLRLLSEIISVLSARRAYRTKIT
jgi:hypothetical protein